jgi:ribose transport system substrate-binding protein
MKKVIYVVVIIALIAILSLTIIACKTTTAAETTAVETWTAAAETTVAAETTAVETTAEETVAKEEAIGNWDPNKTYTIGYLNPDSGNPFWLINDKGIRDQAAKYGNINVITYDAQHDPILQASQAEDLIQKKVDAILMSPYESDTGNAIAEEVAKANIPLFILDVGLTNEKYTSLSISDNYGGAKLVAEYLVKVVGKENMKVFEMQGMLGRLIPAQRGVAFNDVMDENGIKVVVVQTANYLRSEGLTVMENVLEAHPDLNAVFCWNDEMAMGALEAIQNAGKLDQITIVGFDGVKDVVQAVIDGKIAATGGQQPYMFGVTSVDKFVKYLKGESFPKDQLIDTPLVNKDNAVAWMERLMTQLPE